MKKREFKKAIKEILKNNVEDLSMEEKILLVKQTLFSIEQEEITFDTSNKGKKWEEEELRLILNFSPTKENILKLAKTFKRGYGSIEQIFRWASTPMKVIKEKGRENDSFILQIKKAEQHN